MYRSEDWLKFTLDQPMSHTPGEKWVRKSTRVQVLGKGNYFPYAYGYQWWRLQDQELTVGMLAINDAYFALGFGGQFIFVVPHLDLVVVSTAATFGPDEALF